MDYILADQDWMEVGGLDMESLDVSVGDTNDFKLILNKEYTKKMGVGNGFCFFVPGTEFGGIIEDVQSETSSEDVTYMGYTWRGFLEQLIIQPPAGEGYLTVSGDANRVLEQVLSTGTGGMFEVPKEDSGIQVSYKFRYENALDGLTKMLEKHGARLDIKAVEGKPNESFQVQVQAVRIMDYSEELEYNGDDNISVTTRDYRRGINHLICLGSGELEERMVIHLYVQLDGSIRQKQYYGGTAERAAVYDYSGASSEEELLNGGTDRLKELMNYKTASMNIEETNLEIGDIVSARDRDVETLLSKPIESKVLTYSDGAETIKYKLKGEE